MAKDSDTLQELIQTAFELGASDVRIIPAQSIVVEDRFAEMCSSPQCPGYGLSAGCPPHVMKPGDFRDLLSRYEHALVFRIDVPTETLLGDGKLAVAKLIHEISAGIERLAKEKGYSNARGLAAGSCKMIFCTQHEKCFVLDKKGECRHPEQARPSLSGLGVNFLALGKALGWHFEIITKDTKPADVPMGMMAGMVLIG
jgi:predicted metal-binding protein